MTALVKQTGEDEVVKVKSMTTQEIGLNEALADAGIRAYETDLAELIVQLGGDRPSPILVPAGTRLVARNGRIGALPGPLARWSATRDTPAPPRESLRAWWRRTRTPTREDGRTTAGGER